MEYDPTDKASAKKRSKEPKAAPLGQKKPMTVLYGKEQQNSQTRLQ